MKKGGHLPPFLMIPQNKSVSFTLKLTEIKKYLNDFFTKSSSSYRRRRVRKKDLVARKKVATPMALTAATVQKAAA